jgi:hypothetical protein
MNSTKLMVELMELRWRYGLAAAIIGGMVAMRAKSEMVLALARDYVASLPNSMYAPDWMRILANASDVAAVDDAFDDLTSEREFWFLKEADNEQRG